MRDFKTYLSVAPVVSTLWFGSLAGLLIEINQKLLESNIQRRVMAKGKDVRLKVILECTSCVRKSLNKGSRGVFRYITQKNRHNTPSQLELRKFCPYRYKYTIHGEIRNRSNRASFYYPFK
ncbi:50S ribosomal protein L33 chloroplastic [Bienertia sinuspersici]